MNVNNFRGSKLPYPFYFPIERESQMGSSLKGNGSHPGAENIKNIFMLNSAEHEILNAHKYKYIKISAFCRMR